MKRKKVLFLCYYHFPCTETALENIFAKELGKKLDILWLFQGDISNGRKKRWHNSDVLLTQKIMKPGWHYKLANKALAATKYFHLVGVLKREKVNIVIVRDMPLQAIFIALLKKIFKFKLFYQISAPLGIMHISYSKIDKSFKKFWYLFGGIAHNMLTKKAVKIADTVFPITKYHKEEFCHYKSRQKIIPITMGVSEEWIKLKCKKIKYLQELKKDHYLLVYFGSLSPGRNINLILRIIFFIKMKLPNCKIALIGGTKNSWERDQIDITCQKLKIINDVILPGYLNKTELRSVLNYFDLSICAIPPTDYFRISSPTKLYESLGVGLPVIANKGIIEQEKVIRQSGGGVITNYKARSFADEAAKLLKKKKLRAKMATKGKKYVLKHYGYTHIAEKIYPCFK